MNVPSIESGSIRRTPASLLSKPATALGIGYAGLLLLMTITTIDAVRSVRHLERTTAALRTEDRKRDLQLDQLRFDIYRSATVVRDYLQDPDDAHAESERQELELFRTRIDANLRAYAKNLPDAEKEAIRDLHNRVDAYWTLLIPAMQWNAEMRRAKGEAFLTSVVRPFRSDIGQLTRQATMMNERDLDTDEQRIENVEANFRRRMAVSSAIALVLGVILVAVSMRRFQHLEWEAKGRFEELQKTHRELSNLSDRLVTLQEEERRSLSRELHDEIGQALSAVLVELGRLESAPDNETRQERLASARRMTEGSVGAVRNLSLLLRPSMLDDLGLVAALRWQAREVMGRSALKIKVVADQISEDLPDAHRTCIYRVVQEALNNCAKHSQATQIRVVLHRDRDWLSVTVEDDGIGFEPSREKGLGLLGIAERVGRLGGRYSLTSNPGEGAALSVHLPLAPSCQVSEKETA